MSKSTTIELPFHMPRSLRAQEALLADLMSHYSCYAFVSNEDQTEAKAVFRGRWTYEAVAAYFEAAPTTILINDERASGFMRFRLYTLSGDVPMCLAEIEIYFAREGRTYFWCQTDETAGAYSLAA